MKVRYHNMNFQKIPGTKLMKQNEVLNKEKPVISIITPFYNSGATIKQTYYSVLNQTYPFFEWIIINDGSKEEETKVIEELVKTDQRIRYVKQENKGPSVARDYGISLASPTTKYIFFLDSDDILNPTMLECLYWTLETHPDASFAYTSLVNFGQRNFLWEKYLTIEHEKEENLINIATMVKKEDLLEVGCFGIKEKSMYEDWNLWLKLIKARKKPLRVSAPLFWYRENQSGEFTRAQTNHENAMKYVKETAKDIENDQVEVIQFPRYGDDYATCKTYDLVLPDYKKDKRKTILYIFPWMVVGGAEFFNLELIKRLPKDKYRAIILTTTPNRNPLRQEFEDYGEVYDLSSFLDRIDYQTFIDYIISSRKVDLVFLSNTEYGYYVTPYLKSKYPTIPFIDYVHSVDLRDTRGSFGRCTKDIDPYLYGTYCCNHFTKKQLQKKFNKEKVETVYIGTDPEKFNINNYDKEELLEKYNIPKNKKIISFIARLSDEKRPTMFIEIAKRIHSICPDTYFMIAGSGPLMPKVKMKIDKHFQLLGMIDHPEEIYAISDLTINCSSLEGLALTSYESLSMGVPVISTDVGGQTELIDESVGDIVHYHPDATKEIFEKEIDEYVEKSIRVLSHLDKIKKNCRKKIVNHFTLNQMILNMEKIFDDAISKEKNRKMPVIDTTIYELACESFHTSYSNYTNDYYERNLGVYLTSTTSKYQTFYRHMREKLEVLNATNEGKDVIEFLRSFKKVVKELVFCLIRLVKASVSSVVILYKVIKRVLTKPFRN